MEYNHPDFITSHIPHRPPFLWLDRVTALGPDEVVAEKLIPADLEIFKGHYPLHPITPGVLLCEAVFQAGALLIAVQQRRDKEEASGVPVLTRIQGAKFKRQVGPGDLIEIKARLKERLGQAWFMAGSVRVNGKVALKVEFACALAEE
ncbi:MAG: 3-hydroxyacyl-ACP dehydratase FabZ family protein [Thermodesulfobacteriota bacterium]